MFTRLNETIIVCYLFYLQLTLPFCDSSFNKSNENLKINFVLQYMNLCNIFHWNIYILNKKLMKIIKYKY